MRAAGRIVRGLNGLVSLGLGVVLIAMAAFSGYALLDTWRVLHRAEVPAQILTYQPTIKLDQPGNASLAQLRTINPDAVAWVTLDGTRINYPVVQSADNVFYLNRDMYQAYSPAGSVFLDYRNDPGFNDRYSMIYGHNMDGGLMFADLLKYEDQDFFNQHGQGLLFLPDATYRLEIFAYLRVDAYKTMMFGVTYDARGYQRLLQYIRQNAMHYRDISVTPAQRIVALSTCSSATSNDRSIVVARVTELKTTEGAQEP